MTKTACRLALFFPGLLALLVGMALALQWETALLLLFLVGAVYPALGVAALLGSVALRESLRRPLDVHLLLPAAVSLLWPLGFLLTFFGADDPTPRSLQMASIASGLLVCGWVVLGHWGRYAAAAVALSLVLPTALYGHINAIHSTVPLEVRLQSVQVRLQEVTGTLSWEKEGPPLMAERKTLEARIEAIGASRWQAMERVPALAGVLALAAALWLRRRLPMVGLGLACSGALCLALSFSYQATAP